MTADFNKLTPPNTSTNTTCDEHREYVKKIDKLTELSYQILGFVEEKKETNGYIKKRVDDVGARAEEEDKELREDIDTVKEDMATVKGELKYIGWFIRTLTVMFLFYIAYWLYKTYVMGI